MQDYSRVTSNKNAHDIDTEHTHTADNTHTHIDKERNIYRIAARTRTHTQLTLGNRGSSCTKCPTAPLLEKRVGEYM